MKTKIFGALLLLFMFSQAMFAGVTWNAFMEGGIQWYNDATGTVVSNGTWKIYPYSDTHYGYYELRMNLLSDNGWTGWGNLQMYVFDSSAANMQIKNPQIHFSYRPNKINFSLIRNENWTWLGQPYLSIFGQKNVDQKTVTFYFEQSDQVLKGLHTKTVIYGKDISDNYLGTRFDGGYKLGKIFSGSLGFTFSMKRWAAVSNNSVLGFGYDANANITLPAGINVFLGLEFNHLDEAWRGSVTNKPFLGAIDAIAYRFELKSTFPTMAGNFNLNGSIMYKGKNYDADAQFGGTGGNWFEEFFQFLYSFPLKMIDFEFNMKYAHPVYATIAKFGSPVLPTKTIVNTNWVWGYNIWDYTEGVYGTGQVLAYYAKLSVQFKKGIKFFASYIVYKPGSIELWGGNNKYDDNKDNDALFFELKFENETGKINLQYKIYRAFYDDPAYRIEAGGLELVANISSQLKLYSRVLLMNSGGAILTSSGSSTWWNYFGQIQYYPVNNMGIFLEFGNGGDSDRLTSTVGATYSAKQFERKIVLKFNYNI
jgi:hypothetical protein